MGQAIRTTIQALAGLCIMAAGACAKSEATPSTAPASVTAVPGQATAITVDGKGFTPSQVKIAKDKPASLVFTRTSDATCAKEVVFPELKLEKSLPLNTPVTIEVPTTEARTLTFQCGMGMFKSALLIQ